MIRNKVKLREIASITNGFAFKGDDFVKNGVPVIKIKNVKPNQLLLNSVDYVSEFVADKKDNWMAKKGDILLTLTGNRMDGTPSSWVGKACLFREDGKYLINQRVCAIRPISNKVDNEYLAYFLSSWEVQLYFINRANSSGGQANISPSIVYDLDVPLPDLTTQRKIASVLNNIDKKIRTNSLICENIINQVMNEYINNFENDNSNKAIVKASDYFDISIGKTPPRKEHEWFSTNESDVKWASIADMGNCGSYILSTSECLTNDAITRFNIVVVPENTILLSFKLTVGRLAITNEPMATNEAIAHFKTDNKEINPYTYCYLKRFKYGELGSTSSIATAVNSKIIKAMPFVIPDNERLESFNKFAIPAFNLIKERENESNCLIKLRDTLLPKLMTGEIDVTDLDI